MGNSININDTSNLRFNKNREIKYLYQAKRLADNKKSQDQFIYMVQSMNKKLSYIKYGWGSEMITYLKRNQSYLYPQYQKTLLENCKRDGRNQKIFLSQKINKIFKENIQQTYKLTETTLNLHTLKTLVEQSKHFFMVLNWFHKIASISAIDIHSNCCPQETIQSTDDQRQCTQEDKMCNQLINVACKTFRNQFINDRKYFKNGSLPIRRKQNIEIFGLLCKLKRNLCFCEKQKCIEDINNSLMKFSGQQLQMNVDFIESVIQKYEIFGYVWIMKLIGKSDVQFLWKTFCQKQANQLKI